MGKLVIGGVMTLLGIALCAIGLVRLGVRTADGFDFGAFHFGWLFDTSVPSWGTHVGNLSAFIVGVVLLAAAGVFVFLGLRAAPD